jgi:hypothetical protein
MDLDSSHEAVEGRDGRWVPPRVKEKEKSRNRSDQDIATAARRERDAEALKRDHDATWPHDDQGDGRIRLRRGSRAAHLYGGCGDPRCKRVEHDIATAERGPSRERASRGHAEPRRE